MRPRNLASLVILPLVTVACSSSTDLTNLPTTGLGVALNMVADTPDTSGYVEYGNVAALRGNKEFDRYQGYGWSDLAPTAFQLQDALGLDSTKVTTAITAGLPPNTSGLMLGDFDNAAIANKLRAAGAKEDKSGDLTKWTVAGDHEINLNGPFGDLGVVAQLNKIATKPGVFAHASADPGLQAVTTDSGAKLAANSTLSALANCLGDVKFAVLAVAQEPAPTAAGVRDNPTTDVLCVLAPDSGKAQDWSKAATDRLANGMSARSNQPWKTLLADAKAEVTGDRAVRITAKPQTTTDILVQAIRIQDTNSLIPTSP